MSFSRGLVTAERCRTEAALRGAHARVVWRSARRIRPGARVARARVVLVAGANRRARGLGQSLVESEHILHVPGRPGAGQRLVQRNGAAAVLGLLELEARAPDTIAVIVPRGCRLSASTSVLDEIGWAYLHAVSCPHDYVVVGADLDTGLVVGRVDGLLAAITRRQPRLVRLFRFYRELPTAEQPSFFDRVYGGLPPCSLGDVLEQPTLN